MHVPCLTQKHTFSFFQFAARFISNQRTLKKAKSKKSPKKNKKTSSKGSKNGQQTTCKASNKIPSKDPSPAPSKPPSTEPTVTLSPLSSAPSKTHSPAPTTTLSPTLSFEPTMYADCPIEIALDGSPMPNLSLDHEGNPRAITFKYTGGSCGQSFEPAVGPLATTSSTTPIPVNYYITAVSADGGDVYFAGNVAAGVDYTLNANTEADVLSYHITITTFESQGGAILDTTDVYFLE
mmetsp:Transcript_24086/g.50846  ORF Transcript_24086/g.50846 Transcript_24086/m.50846 type:complete len:236 (+) Transcript_24086:214-921(+)